MPSFVQALVSRGQGGSFYMIGLENISKLMLYHVDHFWTPVRAPRRGNNPCSHNARNYGSEEITGLKVFKGLQLLHLQASALVGQDILKKPSSDLIKGPCTSRITSSQGRSSALPSSANMLLIGDPTCLALWRRQSHDQYHRLKSWIRFGHHPTRRSSWNVGPALRCGVMNVQWHCSNSHFLQDISPGSACT